MSTPKQKSTAAPVQQGNDESLEWERRILSITPLKGYLLFYNILSCACWIQIFLLTCAYVFTPHPPPSPTLTSKLLSPLQFFFPAVASASASGWTKLPWPLKTLANQFSGSYHFMGIGTWVKVTQTLAVLEVVHSALGWVKSGTSTVAMQVASRLWAVWGVVAMVPETRDHPLYSSMILAWSLTEAIRYAYYECALLGVDIPILTWFRYSLFYVLYPIGASSEAFLSLSTLPPLSTFPGVSSVLSTLNPLGWLIAHLPLQVKSYLVRSKWGRAILWDLAQKRVVHAAGAGKQWGTVEILRLGLFFIWWPALAMLMNHMIRQRKKVLGKNKVSAAKKRA